MNAKIYFATVLMLGLTVPKIFCAAGPNDDSGEQLFYSIADHDYVKAKQLIREGANVNYKSSRKGDTPLMVAAFNADDLELVQMLVDHHADINAGNKGHYTALFALILSRGPDEYNFSAIAAILLAAGANINAQNDNGETPLHVAAKNGLMLQVSYLLDHGANPNIKNKVGKRPVDLVPENNVQLRRILLLTPHRHHYKK